MIENPVKVNLNYKQASNGSTEFTMKSESFPCCSSVTKREYIIPINEEYPEWLKSF